MKTAKTQRRIDGAAMKLRFAGAVCALFSAVGISHGIHAAAPADGWLIPLLAGSAAALGFAIAWCVLIANVVGLVRTTTIVAIFTAASLLTAISLGASAQAIATAVTGKSAQSAELSEQVDRFATALAEAYANATSWRAAADAATVTATGLRARAESEASGGHGTGKGQGQKYTSYTDGAQSFQAGADQLHELLEDAKREQDRGDNQLAAMRMAAAQADNQGFMAAAGEIGQVIAKLNSIDPRPVIEMTGYVEATKDGINLDRETADFRAKATAALADRKVTDVPAFRPMSLGEATRKQILGSALQGWILAGVIDVLPLIFMAIAFFMSREVWMNEHTTSHKLTPEGRDDEDRAKVVSMRPNRPHAAE